MSENPIRPGSLPKGSIMETKCPKCGYIRSAVDSSPAGECPKCGVIYSKVEAALRTKQKAKGEHPARRSKGIRVLPLTVIVIAVALGGIYWQETNRRKEAQLQAAECGKKEVEKGISELREGNGRFADSEKLAVATPRISLAPQIAALQKIRDDAKFVKRPKCLLEAHAALLVSMDERINAHIAFLGQQDDKVAGHLEQAKMQLEFFDAELDSAKQKSR